MQSYMLKLVQFVCLAHVILAKQESKLPEFVQICSRSDPELNECVRESLEALKTYLPDGIPELFVPQMEPLIIPEIKLDQDAGAIYMHSTFKNIHVRGLSEFVLDDINIDAKKMQMSVSMHFPKLTMNADYLMKGKIMMLPLIGDGQCSGNFTNVRLNTVITAQRFKKGSRQHIKVQNIKVVYTLGKSNIRLDNLFNGDNALGGRMNRFINENWSTLSDEIRPLMENALAEVVRASTEKIFATYSFDELLPE